MKASRVGMLLVFVIISSLLFIPACDDSSAEVPDSVMDNIHVQTCDPIVDVNAGDSGVVVQIEVFNDSAETIRVRIVGHTGNSSKINVSYPTLMTDANLVDPGEGVLLDVTIDADPYTSTHTDDLTFTVEVRCGGEVSVNNDAALVLNVFSSYSAGADYNRIMGIWESPWEDPLYATIISVLIWLAITFLISYLLIPQIIFLFVKEDKENRHEIRKQIWKSFSVLILLFALLSCARIYGVDEYITATLDRIVGIAYILVGAVIVWQVYRAGVGFLFKRASESSGQGLDDSLLPLFNMIGKIVIAVTAFASILAALGFDLLMILTGAGILGLAISLGAQSTLSQFFSGIVLLITRPFKAGDQVIIGNNDKIMKVVKVGLMNTSFLDDGNNGTFTMPNNTVATSVINNITGKSRAYRIAFYVGISYDADVDLAKRLLREAAYENPRVVTDGSYDTPSIRLDSFDASSINMRISAYVEEFDDRGSIGGEIKESLLRKFKENGISIPYTQIDVHME